MAWNGWMARSGGSQRRSRGYAGWPGLLVLAAGKIAIAVLLFWALLAPPAGAQRAADAIPKRKAEEPTAVGGGSGLVIGGVAVDERGKTDIDARMNGWRAAQRLAWPALWARMSGMTEGSAPRLPDSALDGMVSAIEVEREEIGGNRYVARLAVVFDRVRASAYLGQFSELASSPPFLVMPILQDAGARFGHEPGSPWLAAWTRMRTGESPVDYIRIQPTPGDTILLSAWATERRDVRFWQLLVDRYAVADVMMPELILDRSYAGGPVSALLIVRFGPQSRELGRVRLVNRAGDVAALMDEAVRQSDRLYVAALRAGNLLPDPKLLAIDSLAQIPDAAPDIGGGAGGGGTSIRIRVSSPDDATLVAIEQALRATPGIGAVRTTSYILGGMSTLEVTTTLAPDQLGILLDAAGLRLEQDAAGPVVRRRRADEAPLAAPAPAPTPAPAPAAPAPEADAGRQAAPAAVARPAPGPTP